MSRMKSSEAKPLDSEELKTFRCLFQRWLLCSYPYENGSSEYSDAIQTYLNVERDVKADKMVRLDENEDDIKETQRRIAKYGETEI